MDKAIEFNVMGLKCDNPECDYKDMDIKVEDYEKYINKPCPKCGSVLLTQADYDSTMKLIDMVDMINQVFPAPKKGEEIATMSVDMDGSGKMDFSIKDIKIKK